MFNPGLKIGQIVKNADIVEVFKCGNMGGMRRSRTTNTLVIVSDYTKGLYHDKWIGGVLHYTGMGKSGDQDIHWAQNATLAESDYNGVDVHLFEVMDAGEYVYCGRIELVSKPYTDVQPGEDGDDRKGYSYQSKYQGQKYYVQMMYKMPSQVAAQEYSFEMNAHNRTLLSQIQRASRSADAMRLYPGAFSETLVQLMKEKKLSNKKLADASLVGERTIQRLRNEEEYPTTVQTVLGLCYGLQLSVPEAEMLVGKTDFNIKPTNPQNNAYRCVLSLCAENSIYEVNEMLESCGFEPLGSSKMGYCIRRYFIKCNTIG